jgi:hypothetical protein
LLSKEKSPDLAISQQNILVKIEPKHKQTVTQKKRKKTHDTEAEITQKASSRQWRKKAKKPDCSACGTRADTGATQTEDRCRTTENRRDRPEKSDA